MLGRFCVLSGCLAELVFFLYKTGEAMLDASIRPFIVDLVCEDLTQSLVLVSPQWDAKQDMFRNGTVSSICQNLDQFPALEESVQQRAATFLMIYRIMVNVPAVFLGLVCGAWSDHAGRSLPMMIPSVGSVVATLLYLTSLVVRRHALMMIMLGALIQGFMGKSSVITMAVNSYVTDTTVKEERTRKLGKLLAMNFFGLFVGSLLSGALQDISSLQVTLVVVALFHGGSVLVVALCLEESVHEALPSEQTMARKKQYGLMSFQGVKSSIWVLLRPREGGRRTVVIIAFLAMFIHQICKVGEQDVTVLFVQRSPLSWPPSAYGYLLSVDNAVMGGCLLLLLPVLSTFLGMSDCSIAVLGLVFKLVRTMWAGFCTKTWMVYTSVIVGALAGVVTSAWRSLLSKSVDDDETGKIFALASSAETLAKLTGSVLFTNIYSASIHLWAGMAYACAGLIYVLLLILMIWLHKGEQLVAQFNLAHDFTRRLSTTRKDREIPIILEPSEQEEETSSLLPLSASSAELMGLHTLSPD